MKILAQHLLSCNQKCSWSGRNCSERARDHNYTAVRELHSMRNAHFWDADCSYSLSQKKVSDRKCIVRGNKGNPKTKVASYDKQPYFPAFLKCWLWALGWRRKRRMTEVKQDSGNLGIARFHHMPLLCCFSHWLNFCKVCASHQSWSGYSRCSSAPTKAPSVLRLYNRIWWVFWKSVLIEQSTVWYLYK